MKNNKKGILVILLIFGLVLFAVETKFIKKASQIIFWFSIEAVTLNSKIRFEKAVNNLRE